MRRSPLFADISSNNAIFNARQYRHAGHVIVAIKATEGTSYVNPYHRSWCLNAGRQRVAVVHYHFARPDLNPDPVDEARHFLAVALPLAGKRDYLALDLERATPRGWSHDPAWSYKFATAVRSASRFFVILYASRSTLQNVSGDWLPPGRRRIWDADWSNSPDWAPAGYTVAFRQQSGGTAGRPPFELAGVGLCDVDVCRGRTWGDVLAQAPRRW